jgi:hypothetical protein
MTLVGTDGPFCHGYYYARYSTIAEKGVIQEAWRGCSSETNKWRRLYLSSAQNVKNALARLVSQEASSETSRSGGVATLARLVSSEGFLSQLWQL